jgi:hypothetical protein
MGNMTKLRGTRIQEGVEKMKKKIGHVVVFQYVFDMPPAADIYVCGVR